MDASRFDRIVRSWVEAGSRRPILGVLLGGAAGLVGLADTPGKRKKKKKVALCLNGATITVPKKKKGSYLSRGATTGECPPTCLRQCTGKTCGSDNCGGSCGSCPGDKTCQGGTCACPAGEYECLDDICVPMDAVCCTEVQCNYPSLPGRRCLHGECVTWEGTCPAAADSCSSTVGCNGNANCGCYQSTEGETRCGSGVGMNPPCDVCDSSADCMAQFPGIPGVFCVEKGDGANCCPRACLRPCPPPV
jgi:hypothetical protein